MYDNVESEIALAIDAEQMGEDGEVSATAHW